MNVLVVDDEIEKAREISMLLSRAPNHASVTHVTSVAAARAEMRRIKIDLLVVDVNLPSTLDEAPNQNGGFDLLKLIRLDSAAYAPRDIVFITARDELLAEARIAALKRGVALLEYVNRDTWQGFILARAEHLRRLSVDVGKEPVDIAIITALHSPELTAVLSLPYGWETKRFTGNPLNHHFGSIDKDGRKVSILALNATRKGMPSSASLASKVVSQFSPKYLVMLGICAGVVGKVGMGDIVIADPTWDYGSGKRAIDETGSPVFYAAPHQAALETNVMTLAEQLAHDQSLLGRIRAGWKQAVPEGMLKAHLGPMASGSSVIADDAQSRQVVLQQREVVAIEMEAYAVMSAVEYANDPRPRAIAIKSVCDFADSNKGDKWQEYAAYTSSAFADALFRHTAFDV